MKKIVMIMAAMVLLAALAVSCQKEENGIDSLPTFTAHADNGGMKTDLVDYHIYWNSADQVKVFGESGYAIYGVTPRTDDPTWATLTAIENHGITDSWMYRFVYPASMAESSSDNSTLYVTYPAKRNASDSPLKYYPMYGEGFQGDVSFHNLGGLVKIVLPQIDREVDYIRVAADQAIAGKYCYDDDYGMMTHVSGASPDTSVTISVNGNINEVYVSIPDGEYTHFSITIYTTDGYVARKTSDYVIRVIDSRIETITVSNLNFAQIPVATLALQAFLGVCQEKPLVFHYNWHNDVSGATRIDDGQNGIPIWMKISDSQVDVYTPAERIYAPEDCSLMFYASEFTSIDFGDGFNTSNVTMMGYMFEGCVYLLNLDLSSFNTSNVTDMGYMFNGCSNLTSLDLSSFNTSSVEVMSGMFNGCSNLTSLNLSSFDISNVFRMDEMFMNCSGMASIVFSSSATINSTAQCYDMLSGVGHNAPDGCTIHCNSATMDFVVDQNNYCGYDANYVRFSVY